MLSVLIRIASILMSTDNIPLYKIEKISLNSGQKWNAESQKKAVRSQK